MSGSVPVTPPSGNNTTKSRSGSEDKPLRRPPRLIYVVAAGIAAVLILCVTTILGGRDEQEDRPADLTVPATVDDLVSVRQAVASHERKVEGVQSQLQKLSARLAQHRGEVDGQFQSLTHRLQATESKIETFVTEERIAVLEDGITDLRTTATSALKEVHASLASLREQSKHTSVAKQAEPIFPLTLLAIEVWDGELYAAVSYEADIELMRPGQRRGGWEIKHIDPTPGRVVFQDARGRTVERNLAR